MLDTYEGKLSAMKQLVSDGFAVIQINAEQELKQLLMKMQEKLDALDNDREMYFLHAMFRDYIIYAVRQKEASTTEMYKRNYTVNQEGNVDFQGDPVRVLEEVNYTPLPVNNNRKRTKFTKNKKEETSMNGKECSKCEEKIDALIANSATKWEEDDKEYLMGLEEEVLDKIIPETNSQKEQPKKKEVEKKEDPETTQLTDNQKKILDLFTNRETKVEDVLEIFPEEISEQLKSGLALNKKKRKELITKILANAKEAGWEEDTLNGMKIEMLEKIARSISTPADYSLNGGFRNPDTGEEEPKSTPMRLTGYHVNKQVESK